MSKQEVARAVAELQLIEQIVNEYQVRIAALDAAITEHENALSFIEEMKKSGNNMTVLIPIGGGNFIHGVITATEKIEVSVGAGVVMTKPIEEGQQIMQKRKENLIRVRETYSQRVQEYLARAAELRKFIERSRVE